MVYHNHRGSWTYLLCRELVAFLLNVQYSGCVAPSEVVEHRPCSIASSPDTCFTSSCHKRLWGMRAVMAMFLVNDVTSLAICPPNDLISVWNAAGCPSMVYPQPSANYRFQGCVDLTGRIHIGSTKPSRYDFQPVVFQSGKIVWRVIFCYFGV